MHAMGPNVAGVIGTAVAAGTFMAILEYNLELFDYLKFIIYRAIICKKCYRGYL